MNWYILKKGTEASINFSYLYVYNLVSFELEILEIWLQGYLIICRNNRSWQPFEWFLFFSFYTHYCRWKSLRPVEKIKSFALCKGNGMLDKSHKYLDYPSCKSIPCEITAHPHLCIEIKREINRCHSVLASCLKHTNDMIVWFPPKNIYYSKYIQDCYTFSRGQW